MAVRGRSGRKRKNPYRSIVGILMVTLVVVCFVGVMNIHMMSLRSVERSYASQVTSLEKEIKTQEKRAEELEESKAYVQTRQYIEKMAREKLGLVNPDETVVKPRS